MRKQVRTMQIKVSLHEQVRIKQRLGLPKRAMQRHITIVMRNGLKPDQLKGSLLEYINYQMDKYPSQRNNPVVYGHHLYVFNDLKLITVLKLPNELKALVNLLNHQKAPLDRSRKGQDFGRPDLRSVPATERLTK